MTHTTSLELLHERLIIKVDSLHRDTQRRIDSFDDLVKLAEKAKEIYALLARAVSVKVLDELNEVA